LPKFQDDIDTTSRKFYFSHEGPITENNNLKLYATMKAYGSNYGRYPIQVEPEIIPLDDRTAVRVHYDCSQIPQQSSHAVVELELSNGQAYRYLKE